MKIRRNTKIRANRSVKRDKILAATNTPTGEIRIFLTNLGKYNEGDLVGTWVDLPVEDNFQSAFAEIGIGDGYEEYFITDSETDIPGLNIGEYDDIYQLNELAERIQDMDEYQIVGMGLYMDLGYDFEDAIERSEDISVYQDCHTMTDVAYQYVDMIGGVNELGQETLEMYFDYDAYGRDLEINGTFRYVNGDYIELTNT